MAPKNLQEPNDHTETFLITKAQCHELLELAGALNGIFELVKDKDDGIASVIHHVSAKLLELTGNLASDSRRINGDHYDNVSAIYDCVEFMARKEPRESGRLRAAIRAALRDEEGAA